MVSIESYGGGLILYVVRNIKQTLAASTSGLGKHNSRYRDRGRESETSVQAEGQKREFAHQRRFKGVRVRESMVWRAFGLHKRKEASYYALQAAWQIV